MPNRLFLIPTPISDKEFIFDLYLREQCAHVRIFFVEQAKWARRSLKKILPEIPLDQCQFFLLNEHISLEQLKAEFKSVIGQDMAVISEAGCPCVADPGAELVLLAHQNKMDVVPLVGPSSILLALMASGLNGQNFAFNGYLPKEKLSRIKKLKELENRSFFENQTQIFMETPYRNQHLFDDILLNLLPETYVGVASDISGEKQCIKTQTVTEWQQEKKILPETPTIFLLQRKNYKRRER